LTRSIIDGLPKPKKHKPARWHAGKKPAADRPTKKALAVLARARDKGVFA